MEKFIMNSHEYLNYDQLIAHIGDFNIKIESREILKEHLKSFNYYNFFNAYKDIFCQAQDELTDEDIFILYTMDFNFQMILFKYILFFEQSFRESINVILCEDLGHLEYNYLNPNVYPRYSATRNVFSDLLEKLKYKQQPLKYYIDNKLNVPPWILLKQLDFGDLTLIYGLLSSKQKSKIVNHYYGYNSDTSDEDKKSHFALTIEYIRHFRNAIAHSNNINKVQYETKYDHETFIKLTHPDIVTVDGFRSKNGNGDAYGLIINLVTLLRNNILRNDMVSEINLFLESISLSGHPKSLIHRRLFKEALRLPSYLDHKLQKLLYVTN